MNDFEPLKSATALMEQFGYIMTAKNGPLGWDEGFTLGSDVLNDFVPGSRIWLSNAGLTVRRLYVVTQVIGQIVLATDWGSKFVEESMQETNSKERLYDGNKDQTDKGEKDEGSIYGWRYPSKQRGI